MVSAALAGGAEILITDEGDAAEPGRDAFDSRLRQGTEALKRMLDLGKPFATIIFFSPHADRAESSLDVIKKAIRDRGITLETRVIPLEPSMGGIVPTAFDRALAKRPCAAREAEASQAVTDGS